MFRFFSFSFVKFFTKKEKIFTTNLVTGSQLQLSYKIVFLLAARLYRNRAFKMGPPFVKRIFTFLPFQGNFIHFKTSEKFFQSFLIVWIFKSKNWEALTLK